MENQPKPQLSTGTTHRNAGWLLLGVLLLALVNAYFFATSAFAGILIAIILIIVLVRSQLQPEQTKPSRLIFWAAVFIGLITIGSFIYSLSTFS